MNSIQKRTHPIQIAVVVLLAVLFVILTQAVLAQNSITTIDSPVGKWVVSQTTPDRERLFNFITTLGSYPVVRAGTILVGLWLAFKRDWRRLLMLLALFAAAVLLTPVIKDLVARTRPLLPQDNLYSLDYSFPSGHTINGTVFYMMTGYLGLVYAPRTWIKWMIITLSGIAILMIGLSRVFLEVHFMSDVLGGWVAGGLLFLLAHLIFFSVIPKRQVRTEETS
jgi:undecaprenyl-diphosphatase